MSSNEAHAIVPFRPQAALMVADEQAKATGMRLIAAFPQDVKTLESAMQIARVAIAYELDPLLGELIPYQGKPYITIDGRIRIADRHPAYDGYDLDPATPAERAALGCGDYENVWKCTVFRRDRSRPTVAYGRANHPGERNPVAKTQAAEMAQKRAVHRAMRAAFPVPIPGVEESLSYEQIKKIHALDRELGVSDDERRAELEATFGVDSSRQLTSGQASAYIDGRMVDGGTGEVIDVPAEIVPEVPFAEQHITRERAETIWQAAQTSKRAAQLKSWLGARKLSDLTNAEANGLQVALRDDTAFPAAPDAERAAEDAELEAIGEQLTLT